MPSAARLGDLIGHAPPIPPDARGPGGPGGVPTGLIVGPCSGNVFINGIRAAREGVDLAVCSLHPPLPLQIASGSSNVFINGCPAARLGDLIKCSAIIITGAGNVFIGGGGSGAGGTVKTDLVMPECETGSVMLQSLEAADADAGCFAPGALGPAMSYGEQMRKVGGFVGDLGIGAARGLLNLVPETVAFAYRMSGYAIAGVVSHIDSDISGAMFAKYEKVTGRIWQYENSVQAFGGVAAQVASPMIYKGASAAGVALYNADRGAAWVASGSVSFNIEGQASAINFQTASVANKLVGPQLESPVQRLLYGARAGEGLPGAVGTPISGRPLISEIENLTVKHNVEFAVTYKMGPGKNGAGGQYYLHSGEGGSVTFPKEADRMLINHSHPGINGAGGARYASDADMAVMEYLKSIGSPQRSSLIIPVDRNVTVRFGLGRDLSKGNGLLYSEPTKSIWIPKKPVE